MEFIRAMPPAAAVPLRNAVGSVQNNGAIANIPMAPIESTTIFLHWIREVGRQRQAGGGDQKSEGSIPLALPHTVRKKRPDHDSDGSHRVGGGSDEPGLKIADAEIFDDRRQPKAQTVAGRGSAKVNEAEREHTWVLQRLPQGVFGV